MIPLDGRVNGRADIAPMTGVDLFCEKIAVQVRVLPLRIYFRIVINITVVAASETGHGIYMSSRKRACEFIWIKGITNAGDVLAGMKI